MCIRDSGYSSIPLYDFEEKVTSIEVGWDNPDIIYVATYDGYWGEKHVWRSDDAGISFVDITPSFPGITSDDWIPFDITINDDDAYNVFIAHADVAYDANNYKKSIGEQKWIALFPLGYEAWAEWRRIGFPALTAHEFALNPSKQIPLRHAYPSSESTINEESYQAALDLLGGKDDETARIFWDVD